MKINLNIRKSSQLSIYYCSNILVTNKSNWISKRFHGRWSIFTMIMNRFWIEFVFSSILIHTLATRATHVNMAIRHNNQLKWYRGWEFHLHKFSVKVETILVIFLKILTVVRHMENSICNIPHNVCFGSTLDAKIHI